MNLRTILISTFLCAALCPSSKAQMPSDDPDVLLKQALHLGDLYNWADAAPMFTEAEQLYSARGDNRNALYAHLGRITGN